MDTIDSYNYMKKEEFIRVGLNLYPAKNRFVDKIPSDAIIVDKKIQGDVNTVDSPKNATEEKDKLRILKVPSGRNKERVQPSTNTQTPNSIIVLDSITAEKKVGWNEIIVDIPQNELKEKPRILKVPSSRKKGKGRARSITYSVKAEKKIGEDENIVDNPKNAPEEKLLILKLPSTRKKGKRSAQTSTDAATPCLTIIPDAIIAKRKIRGNKNIVEIPKNAPEEKGKPRILKVPIRRKKGIERAESCTTTANPTIIPDAKIAEKKIGGDENILSDSKNTPEEKEETRILKVPNSRKRGKGKAPSSTTTPKSRIIPDAIIAKKKIGGDANIVDDPKNAPEVKETPRILKVPSSRRKGRAQSNTSSVTTPNSRIIPDAIIAENKIGGGENIVAGPKNAPEVKRIPRNLKFPSSRRKGKLGPSTSTNAATPNSNIIPIEYRNVTHRRFTGDRSDFQIILMEQKSIEPKKPVKNFSCFTCGFNTTSIDVIALHHLKGRHNKIFSGSNSKRKNAASILKNPRGKSKKIT